VIREGEPMLILTTPGVKRERYRCQGCAGDVPPDLPPLAERVPVKTTKKIKSMTAGQMRAALDQYRSPYKD
jgi:hypothetical protein